MAEQKASLEILETQQQTAAMQRKAELLAERLNVALSTFNKTLYFHNSTYYRVETEKHFEITVYLHVHNVEQYKRAMRLVKNALIGIRTLKKHMTYDGDIAITHNETIRRPNTYRDIATLKICINFELDQNKLSILKTLICNTVQKVEQRRKTDYTHTEYACQIAK